MQISSNELDADQLFSIVQHIYGGVVEQLDCQTVVQAVIEAIDTLHTASELNGYTEVSNEASLVISLLQQWLVRYFCMKLMQLMTPEALILNRNKIPLFYLVNYLTHQNHFSLKKLIQRCYMALESINW